MQPNLSRPFVTPQGHADLASATPSPRRWRQIDHHHGWRRLSKKSASDHRLHHRAAAAPFRCSQAANSAIALAACAADAPAAAGDLRVSEGE